jgi:hypothetical protein
MATITITGNPYWSVCAVAEADVVLAGSFDFSSIWASSTTDQKGLALVEVSRRMSLHAWKGEASTSDLFPRTGLEGYTSAATPPSVITGACLAAAYLLKVGSLGGETQPVKSASSVGTRVTFFSPDRTSPYNLPAVFFDYSNKYMEGPDIVGSSHITRSSFLWVCK